MRYYKGYWYYQGREYATLRAALLAAWSRKEMPECGTM